MMGEAKRNRGKINPRRLTVAVCIPTIPGRESELMSACLSVMSQTRQPDQFLVELDENRTGAAETRNRLLARVTSDVIAWLDDDDRFGEHHLSACMRVLELDHSISLVYPRPIMVGGEDPTATTRQGIFPVSPWGLRFGPEQAQHIRRTGSFIPMTHLVRTDAVRRAGGFPLRAPGQEDLVLDGQPGIDSRTGVVPCLRHPGHLRLSGERTTAPDMTTRPDGFGHG
jgi:hypothetical protein